MMKKKKEFFYRSLMQLKRVETTRVGMQAFVGLTTICL